jgi:site-specific DNA-cytosine methylase
MRFGSLFAGIGGIDLDLERAGMACAFQVERDPYCKRPTCTEGHDPVTEAWVFRKSLAGVEPKEGPTQC